MFTGIIQSTGTVVSVKDIKHGRFVTFKTDPKIVRHVPEGGSVSVNGVCLTAINRSAVPRVPHKRGIKPRATGDILTFELINSTLTRTTLGALRVGDVINIEPAMLVGQPIGGHFVSGHVDGVGRVRKVAARWHTQYLTIHVPRSTAKYLAPQGSIVVNGVSLTIVEVCPDWFSIALTTYTQKHTNLGGVKVGDKVNIEVDMLAKYLAKFLKNYALRNSNRQF